MTTASGIPWQNVSTPFGEVPFYVIAFDEHGECTSPEALEHLLKAVEPSTDVFIISHGWNNDWNAATSRYDLFLQRFLTVLGDDWGHRDRSFRPVFVGVFWPSAILVMPWEQAPRIASGDGRDPEVDLLADLLQPAARDEFRTLVAESPGTGLAPLARLLAPVLGTDADELGAEGGPVEPQDLLSVWSAVNALNPGARRRPGGFIDDDQSASHDTDPLTAGWNPFAKVRDAIRATTVLVMKDRSGRVGAAGVARMLRQITDAGEARVALIGHSYGCKVVLSALCVGESPTRAVESVLLLQPALSCFGFTADANGRPGGYRPALERVRQPIITTYSRNDEPLTKYFHLAVRRASDLNEAVIAAAPNPPPSKFAALGGYGPHGADDLVTWIDMPGVGDPYPDTGGPRIVAVDGTAFIESHGAVETPQTAWALLSQTKSRA